MKILYAVRDAFFWWAGVWATVTMFNSVVRRDVKRRNHQTREQYRREFMEDMRRIHAEQDAGTEADHAEKK